MAKQYQRKNKHRQSRVPTKGKEQKRQKQNQDYEQSTYQNENPIMNEKEKTETGEGVVSRILHALRRNSDNKEARGGSAKDEVGYSVADLANDITAEHEYNESSI